MPIDRRFIIGDGSSADERRWPDPNQLVCPVCRKPAQAEPPAYWKVADGPRPDWSHEDREPLCLVPCDDGPRPAVPMARGQLPDHMSHEPSAAEWTGPGPLPKLRYLDESDYRRSHLLPDDVVCNIPRRSFPGEYGAWNIARGLLVETCRVIGARPLALHQTDDVDSSPDAISTSITTARFRMRTGREAEFIATRRSGVATDRLDSWTISVNGRSLPHESRLNPPSPWSSG
ncbi:hypothetical protein [Pseudonocardia lacus]|uniref:hypothetical protein n=1 Tax=Pseudonocardia lacus TaxID=2835865 RepID=UPI001BDD0B96|nr:hypothetical protein [Pseudonocardia lacus]